MISLSKELDSASQREILLTRLLEAGASLEEVEGWGGLRRALGAVARALHAGAAYLLTRARSDEPIVTWHPPDAAPPSNRGLPVMEDTESNGALKGGAADVTAVNNSTESRSEGMHYMRCAVVIDGEAWGYLVFERSRNDLADTSSEAMWTTETAQFLVPFARHVAAWLQHKEQAAGVDPWGTQKDGASGELPSVEARELQQRVESQRALVEASKLLVSPGEVKMEELLRIVGEATGADYAYLLSIQPEDGNDLSPLAGATKAQQSPIDLDAYAHYEWRASNSTRPRRTDAPRWPEAEARDDGATLAVPLLSAQHLLFGYLGIEFDEDTSPLNDEDVRLLNVLGDMLSAYLQRQITDRALRESERRYRHFVDTISEAIWRIDLTEPVSVDQPEDTLVQALHEHGIMAECNGELAQLFGAQDPDEIIGCSVHQLTALTGQRIVHDVVAADFRLQGQEYVTRGAEREPRYFIVNTSGVVEDGRLLSVWGSTTEVTARVRLERRMVTALEQQQQRIGRDLHDSVGQLLTGVRMFAQNLEERHFQAGTAGHGQIRSIINYANEAAQHVSDLQRGLMPVQMERAGLAQALQELASNTDVLPDVACGYDHDGTTDVLDPETKLQLYRIAQEATNNALKHAEPSCINITLKSTGGTLVLKIEDDGTGFDVEEATEDSLGLHSMYYRARAIRAELDVESTPGEGTVVHCHMNRDDAAEPEASPD